MPNVITLLLGLVLCISPVCAQQNFDTSSFKQKIASVDRLFSQSKKNTPGYAVGIFYNGNVLYKKGYGMADIERKVPMTTSTRIDVASLSKQFTAMCILLLEEEGKLKLDDDIKMYMPYLPFKDTITIKHLLLNTSGLDNYLNIYRKPKDADKLDSTHAMEYMLKSVIQFKPGTEYEYCPTNYMFLSLIVQQVSGKNLREFALERIFRPLGMNNTAFEPADSTWAKNRAIGYMAGKKKDQYINCMIHNKNIGDVGVITTIDDLFLWDNNFYNNQLGKKSPQLISRMKTVATLPDGTKTSYGYGLATGLNDSLVYWGHNGRSRGYGAKMRMFTDDRFSVYVLSNAEYPDNAGPYKIGDRIIGIFRRK
jgi:CubicO group peptidase (beta-lactamase class C family)